GWQGGNVERLREASLVVWEGCSGKCAILIAMQIFDHDELPCVLIFSLSLKSSSEKNCGFKFSACLWAINNH
ncbi:MAG: hypothetical protein ACD_10C00026G0004, partial [uncultured bacterium]